MAIRAHSFDVFDTLLVRTWARPADVLHAVAERVAGGPPGAPGRAELVAELVRERRAAEREAMRRLRVEAVDLGRVYADGDRFRALGVDPEAMHAAELEEERAGARAVRAGAERVAAARAAGLRVVFVSDMYLPGAEIRARLEEHGIARPGDPVYVSGELGISKFTGRLFLHVLEREGLAAHELVHHGDDAHTDDASPARLGIAVRPLRLAKPSRFERAALADTGAPRPAGAQLAGLTRAVRVGVSPEGAAGPAATVLCGAVAPLFGAFVAWVLRTAREEGLERLYFVSRDAQVLLGAARELRRDGDPECRYLFGSRQAWFLPGVHEVERGALSWITEPRGSLRTPRALLAKLELAPEDLAGALRAAGLADDEPLAGAPLDRFWDVLEASAPLVRERAAAARARLVRYLHQEGLTAPGRWALVDLGWRLTAQAALRRVLAEAGAPDAVLGLYLGVGANRMPASAAGPFRAFVLGEEGTGPEVSAGQWLLRSTGVVEQVFAMADHGSCTGYADDGDRVVPVLRPQAPDPRRAAYVRLLHDAVAGVAREAARTRLFDEHLPAVRAVALDAGQAAVERPTREEARALGWLEVTDDQNETRARRLAEPFTVRDLAARARRRVVADPAAHDTLERVWDRGSRAVTAPPVRAALEGLEVAVDVARDAYAAARRSPPARPVLRALARRGVSLGPA